jgi:lactate permease
MLETIFSFFPVGLLIWLMVKKNGMPSNKALPLSALVLYFIVLIVFRSDPNLVHANVVKGLLVAWTPILIIAGAIFLFKTMEFTGGLGIIKQWLNSVSENKVAQLMIVGWAFPFLIEGASGFGTPAAIAAPILVGLGFNPIRVAILALIMNTVPVSFGAVGTPTWFGFSGVDLSESETLLIGFKSAIIHSIIALVIPLIALSRVVKWRSIFKNWGFILISVSATVIPYLIIAKFNYEFPSLIGGAFGLLVSVIAAKKGLGLSSEKTILQGVSEGEIIPAEAAPASAKIRSVDLLKAMFPLWGTILVLIVTRISQLGVKALLTASEPSLSVPMGSLGEFSISPSLVVGMKDIFNTDLSWSHAILYVPSILPFVFISLLAFWWYRSPGSMVKSAFSSTLKQMKNPTLALLGALVFVNLMMMGGADSAVNKIGESLADVTGDKWVYFSSFMGALGSFFSGSATISNLTFASIQDSIATTLSLDRTTILALQSVGGSLGNMVSINNIVAVASILALGNMEGYILKRTVVPMVIYAVLAGVLAVLIF